MYLYGKHIDIQFNVLYQQMYAAFFDAKNVFGITKIFCFGEYKMFCGFNKYNIFINSKHINSMTL